VPLDLDSSPWRRWSPILLDAVVAAFVIHVELAVLHAVFPTASDAAISDSGVALFFSWLAPTALLEAWWWGRAAVLLAALVLLRAALTVAGWHRLMLFPVVLAVTAAAHLHWLERLLTQITA
jgi:hypothetical protein